jgi:hypothetical protein
MSGSGATGPLISDADLSHLAAAFDHYENALDPCSEIAIEAGREFDRVVHALYIEGCGKGMIENIAFETFRAKMRSVCRQYIRKNR